MASSRLQEGRSIHDILDSMVQRIALNGPWPQTGYYAAQALVWIALPGMLIVTEALDLGAVRLDEIRNFAVFSILPAILASWISTVSCMHALLREPSSDDPYDDAVHYLAAAWFSIALGLAAHPVGAVYRALWSSDGQRIWAIPFGIHDWTEVVEFQIMTAAFSFLFIRSIALRSQWIPTLRWSNAVVTLASLGSFISVLSVGLSIPLGDSPGTTSLPAYAILPLYVFVWSLGPFTLATSKRGIDGGH